MLDSQGVSNYRMAFLKRGFLVPDMPSKKYLEQPFIKCPILQEVPLFLVEMKSIFDATASIPTLLFEIINLLEKGFSRDVNSSKLAK